MDGSTASLIAIPIVVTLTLGAWLLLVAYAEPRPAAVAPVHAGHDAIPEKLPELVA